MSTFAKEIAEAILEKPSFVKTVTVETPPPKLSRWEKLLVKLRIRKAPQPTIESKDLYISPAKIDTIYELSGLLHEISAMTEVSSTYHTMAHKIAPLLARVIAVGITNKGDQAPDWLVNAISSQFTSAELNIAAKEVYRRLDYENFFGVIISLKAANMIDIQETEVPGQPSVAS